MKLYSIRHTQTGLFFRCTDGRNTLNWNSSPIFWKTIDGTVANLRRIGGEHHKRHRAIDSTNFDPKRLSQIEVIVTDVSVHGEKAMPASSFFESAALDSREDA
jgi:hypothetical protein